jgi:hypothetical protein
MKILERRVRVRGCALNILVAGGYEPGVPFGKYPGGVAVLKDHEVKEIGRLEKTELPEVYACRIIVVDVDYDLRCEPAFSDVFYEIRE